MRRPPRRMFLVLAGLYASLIFVVSSFPSQAFPESFSGLDKLAHALEYVPFGFLLMGALWPRGTARTRALLITVFVVMLYALSDEFHQSFVPGRQPDVMDGVMDVLGGLAGGSLFRWPK